jgi:hypothetical protein
VTILCVICFSYVPPSPSASHGSKCINDTASNSDYTATNDWLIINNELERKQKEDIWLKGLRKAMKNLSTISVLAQLTLKSTYLVILPMIQTYGAACVTRTAVCTFKSFQQNWPPFRQWGCFLTLISQSSWSDAVSLLHVLFYLKWESSTSCKWLGHVSALTQI